MNNRRSMTWAACDALAAAGEKPSIGKVREWTLTQHGSKRGSDADVQADINAWFKDLLHLRTHQEQISGLPEPVAALARELWLQANEAASKALDKEREAIAGQARELEHKLAASEERLNRTIESLNETKNELAVAREAITGRDAAIAQLERNCTDLRATLLVRDERINTLTGDLDRKDKQVSAVHEQLDAFRKHTLLHIDEARAEGRYWQAECHRQKESAAQYLVKVSSLEIAAAEARGRVTGLEELIATAREQIASLESQLTLMHSRANSEIHSPTPASPGKRAKKLPVSKAAKRPT